MDYAQFFKTAFGKGDPFDYQYRLARVASLPSLLNVATGAGKTAAIVGSWLWRRWQKPETVGRRLVYCLPMRTLVEQTESVVSDCIRRLEESNTIPKDRFRACVLMGGDVSDEWDTNPEKEYILIGTQDMLLSRALNRGYAMSRFRWPVHFGLLNNDCLWVFDEIQLMGNGLATTSQLAAFRSKFNTFGRSDSIWMSATLDRDWLKTFDFASQVTQLQMVELSETDRANKVLANRLNAAKAMSRAPQDCRLPKGLADFIKQMHQTGTQTLIVVNRVNRAREVYDELNRIYGKLPVKAGKRRKTTSAVVEQKSNDSAPEIELIHSRFRPFERTRWKALFDEKIDEASAGRIIVATQVIEAGVDISSRLMITDLAPFQSLVQRFGRCNRNGEFASSQIYWVDRPLTEKSAKLANEKTVTEEDLNKIAKPYEASEMMKSKEILDGLQSASPSDLSELDYHSPYTPAHVLRRRDIVDLFDSTPDLSGYDLDVSRFVRGGEERNVSVAWRELTDAKPDKSEPRLMRDELCSVRIHEIKEFLKSTNAWTWDALDGDWRKVNTDEIHPGLTLLLDAQSGGYDERRGWDVKSKRPVSVVNRGEEKNEAYGDDPLTWLRYAQTLAAHSLEARQAAERIASDLSLPGLEFFLPDLLKATQHHDWGKSHQIFQATLHGVPKEADLDNVTLEPVLAKSKSGQRHRRKHFRHEFASALALLQTGATDLAVYLAASHHGKVRLSIRALPGETKPEKDETRFARGIWHGDKLPQADLGDGVLAQGLELDLEPMLLGRSESGSASWLERMLALRDRLGVFRLAYLECLIRAADVWASSNPKNVLSQRATGMEK